MRRRSNGRGQEFHHILFVLKKVNFKRNNCDAYIHAVWRQKGNRMGSMSIFAVSATKLSNDRPIM